MVRELKTIFARFGIPEALVTDNGPQFASKEFGAFAKSWSFNHITTSPRYPQSNSKAENAVKTVKRLFEKCKESGVSEFQALLDWRNTPTEGMATSPAQRLMGRRCRTLLPMSESLLRPSYSLRDDVHAMSDKKRRQKKYYDRHAKPLPSVSPGEMVRMRLPGQKVWTPAWIQRVLVVSLSSLEVPFIGEIGVTLLKLARILLRARPSFQRKHRSPVVLEQYRLDTQQCTFHRLRPLPCRFLSCRPSNPMCHQPAFEHHREKEDPRKDFAIML